MSDEEKATILVEFVKKVVSSQRDLEPEFAQALNDHFWEFYEPL